MDRELPWPRGTVVAGLIYADDPVGRSELVLVKRMSGTQASSLEGGELPDVEQGDWFIAEGGPFRGDRVVRERLQSGAVVQGSLVAYTLEGRGASGTTGRGPDSGEQDNGIDGYKFAIGEDQLGINSLASFEQFFRRGIRIEMVFERRAPGIAHT